jgi:4-aminobutyrate aminotransferase-like enzyme
LEALDRYLKGGAYNPAGAVGAILVEPMQGRGGIRIPQPEFMQGLREIATQHSLVLIADEIFTGFGRTGRTFAVEHSNVVPDLLCVGKALANGFPISACIGTPDVMNAWPDSDGEAIHTSTFLGNPLGCAMGVAALKEFSTKRLAQRAARLGEIWKNRLEKALADHPNVAEIRGAGLMIGIELVKDRASLAAAPDLAGRAVTGCLQEGLLLLSGGGQRNVLTLTPPLTITERDLEKAARILEGVLKSWKN